MLETFGEDLFDKIPEVDAICITTNCSLIDGKNPMPGGVAGAAHHRWGKIESWYGLLLHHIPNVPCILGWIDKECPSTIYSLLELDKIDAEGIRGKSFCCLIAYPTMYDICEPADLDLVVRSATLLIEMADDRGFEKVALAAPGIGIGGLSYEHQVKPGIQNILDDRFIVMRK